VAGKKQFDVDEALERAMTVFWQRGHATTSIDDLTAAMGLNRSSLYATFGDKDALYARCLERYAARYGERFDAALAGAGARPMAALEAFFEVTLQRIADPDLPDGCLMAQSTMVAPMLPPAVAAFARQALASQHERLRAALEHTPVRHRADELALHLAAVNQSLALMSRAGATDAQLRSIVRVTLEPLARDLAGD
jgi:TetR/AcrR family transcriptional regulator, copper-responsive repressor